MPKVEQVEYVTLRKKGGGYVAKAIDRLLEFSSEDFIDAGLTFEKNLRAFESSPKRPLGGRLRLRGAAFLAMMGSISSLFTGRGSEFGYSKPPLPKAS